MISSAAVTRRKGTVLIVSTPVARWSWGRDHQPGSEVVTCLREPFTIEGMQPHGENKLPR